MIYRQKAISVLGAQCKDKYNKTCGEHCECMEYMALRDMPSAQRKGHWIDASTTREQKWKCSECGEETTSSAMGLPRYRFCPMCGAYMRGGNDG